MASHLQIRECTQKDIAAIVSIYPQAFPEEDLVPIVRSLLDDPDVALALVGVIDSRAVANVIFTRCSVGDEANVALLAPLAVAPEFHGQGIGSAMVRAGFEEMQKIGVDCVFVLGDPAYYGRFGFQPDTQIEPPFSIPPEWNTAWQSRCLGTAELPHSGKLVVPRQWDQPSLWAP